MKRLKGAIDRQIAEEQSKQKAGNPGQSSAAAGSATRRSRSSSGTKTQSPARRPRKKLVEDTASKDTNGDGTVANPDPAVFEAAFVIDDDDSAPSRVATPAPTDNANKAAGKPASSPPTSEMAGPQNGAEKTEEGKGAAEPPASSTATAPAAELSPEVQTRLRKLEKMEKAYPGLSSCPRRFCSYHTRPLLTHGRTPALVSHRA